MESLKDSLPAHRARLSTVLRAAKEVVSVLSTGQNTYTVPEVIWLTFLPAKEHPYDSGLQPISTKFKLSYPKEVPVGLVLLRQLLPRKGPLANHLFGDGLGLHIGDIDFRPLPRETCLHQ
jgi:hypothetical protein